MGPRETEVSHLEDEKGLPIELAQTINEGFQAGIGKMLSVNDNYGSEAMRAVILDEVNDLRRAVLRLVGRLVRGDRCFDRLQPAAAEHRVAAAQPWGHSNSGAAAVRRQGLRGAAEGRYSL